MDLTQHYPKAAIYTHVLSEKYDLPQMELNPPHSTRNESMYIHVILTHITVLHMTWYVCCVDKVTVCCLEETL